MMTRRDAQAILDQHRDELRRFGILRARLVGPAGPAETLDVLVDFDPAARLARLDAAGVGRLLSALLGCPVGLVDERHLQHYVRERILATAEAGPPACTTAVPAGFEEDGVLD